MADDTIYGAHPDIARLARQEFADHQMRRGPGYSWRLAKPGTGIYSFRVTWAPGVVMVSGDIGHAAYQVWPSFGTLWKAVDLIADSQCDYLTGKSGVAKEFDREGTVRAILSDADERMGYEDFGLWEKILHEYGGYGENPRNGAHQMKMAARLRDDMGVEPNSLWQWLGDDAELMRYQDPASTRWHYEAVRLWARTMLAAEPTWHLAWRRGRAELQRLRQVRRHIVRRPSIIHVDHWLNGSKDWMRRGDRYCAIYPLTVFGYDLSRWGLWTGGGSSMSVDDRSTQLLGQRELA